MIGKDWSALYEKRLETFLKEAFGWNPDYVVPVGRKAAKLLRLHALPSVSDKVFYKEYFEFTRCDVKGKKISVVDDSVLHGSSLRSYRDYFVSRGAEVRTFGFIAHRGLLDGSNECYDPKMTIPGKIYLSEPAYQEYLLLQAAHLVRQGFYQDLNHIVVEVDLNVPTEVSKDTFGLRESLEGLLSSQGYLYDVPPTSMGPSRLSLDRPEFLPQFSQILTSTQIGGISKIRFHFSNQGIVFIPMVFPRVLAGQCPLPRLDTPFTLPCQVLREQSHPISELCYWSFTLLFSSELGRTFVSFLKRRQLDAPAVASSIGRLTVREIDFVRYLGPQLGHDLAVAIRRFMLADGYVSHSALKEKLATSLILESPEECGSFENESITGAIDYLRKGYRNAVIAAGTRVDVHFASPLANLRQESGASHALCMEMLDSLCDLGIMVPLVDSSLDPVERSWRTGEVPEAFEWDRTTLIIPLAIRAAADEFRLTKPKVDATLLMKMLANFAYDYPGSAPSYEPLHCLVRSEDLLGTTVAAHHELRAPRSVQIYEDRKLGSRYRYVRNASGTEKSFFECSDESFEDLNRYFGADTGTTVPELVAYFGFLAAIAQKLGNSALTSISVCRTRDVFLSHLQHNIARWFQYFGEFLDSVSESYSENPKYGPLSRAGLSSNAGLDKIGYWNRLDQLLVEIRGKFKELRFLAASGRILQNIERKPVNSETLNEFYKILTIQRVITGLTIFRVLPERRERPEHEMTKWAVDEFKMCGVTYDPLSILKAQDIEKLDYQLRRMYSELMQMTRKLPKVENDEKSRERALYADKARNRAVAIVKDRGWESPVFVHLDLSGFRDLGDESEPEIADFYRADEIAKRFGAVCVNRDPGGDDSLLYVVDGLLSALRLSSEVKQEHERFRIPTKGGIASAKTDTNDYYGSLVPTVGLAKDLCTYKDAQGHKNSKEILVCEILVNQANKEGIAGEYFAPHRQDQTLFRGQMLQVFKFDWHHFLEDMR